MFMTLHWTQASGAPRCRYPHPRLTRCCRSLHKSVLSLPTLCVSFVTPLLSGRKSTGCGFCLHISLVVEIHSYFDPSRALHKSTRRHHRRNTTHARVGALRPMPHCLGIGSTRGGPGRTPTVHTWRPWVAHSRDDKSHLGCGATTDPRAPTHSTPQRAQSVCRMFLRSCDVGW